MLHKHVIAVSVVLLHANSVAAEHGVAAFSMMHQGQDMTPWRESRLRGKKQTDYSLVLDDGVVVVGADANGSASALVHEIRLNPSEYPIIHWRWKISRMLRTSDIATKKGDDYPARVYVTFDHDLHKVGWFARSKLRMARMIYGAAVPAAAICYVWDREASEGTSMRNAYTDRVQMIVVQSGMDRVGQWVSESHNVYDDYRAAFNEEPPAISSVVIATDTDDTGETAMSWFGDVEFAPAAKSLIVD